MNSSAASIAGLTVEEMTLNSSLRKKHLEIKTEESGNEKILTVKLSWTILHYTDSLIGHETKWQFKIKAFEWDNLSILKFRFFWLKKKTKTKSIFGSPVSYLLFNSFWVKIALSGSKYVPFSGNFCKSLIIKRINRIYGFTNIQRYICRHAHSYERLATQQLVIFMIQRTLFFKKKKFQSFVKVE